MAPSSPTQIQSLVIRLAGAADAEVVARLAALDSSSPPEGATLLAYRGGEATAALGLVSGRVVADPFTTTADVVALLRERAAQLTGRPRRSRYAAAATLALSPLRARRSATTR